ncbi:hypothetical protein TCAL_16863 [Tigriopus californicus]|uniref:Uncharacterized protein n=1 Tax=Tigriopus californicus TaxID=6832 RepID=A0A553P9Q2_TIGCA|nr:uncharacterized protein LOC131877252 [Tigriopus californicus]TRY74403.1 hypothetical protein TCAL_16863 [Tigriopus californicus]
MIPREQAAQQAMAPKPDHDELSQAPADADDQNNNQSADKRVRVSESESLFPPELEDDDDPEVAELSKLRCTSLQTEEIASREKAKQDRAQRRQNRCSDYPGLAFGSAMFGSDTVMKFNIIKNELHNIMNSQLKRVDGEVSAFSHRIKEFDQNLEKSEYYIKTATQALAEAVQFEMDHRQDENEGEEEENALSHFDAQLKVLEGQLVQAQLMVAQADEGFISQCASSASKSSRPATLPTERVAVTSPRDANRFKPPLKLTSRPPLRQPNLPPPILASSHPQKQKDKTPDPPCPGTIF